MNKPLEGLRIGLLTASASRLGGGVFEAVVQQAAMIRDLGGEPVIFALRDAYSDQDAHRFEGCELHCCPVRGPAQTGYAPQLVRRLVDAGLDCLHLHGIWMYPSRAATQWARLTGRRYLISPHGMLDAWITGRGRWKKALARAGYERASWCQADLMHALTQTEVDDISRESGRQDALIIPNAAPPAGPVPTRLREPRLVFLGRIHPKKNVLALLAGWGMAKRPNGAVLEIAGWGDPQDVAELEAAVSAAGPDVHFLGPVFGDAKQQLLNAARFTILPSFGEGLPMSVLEGWAAGAPAILTANCNLPEGFAAGAALECGHSAPSIAQAIEQALAMGPDEWLRMAGAALDLAAGPFCAAWVSHSWARAYKPTD